MIDLDTGTTIAGFSQIWKGWIRSDQSGEATFFLEADDHATLWMGGKLVAVGPRREGSTGESVPLQAGHALPVEIYFVQRSGSARLRLYWSWQGGAKELVPGSLLWHDAKDLAAVTGMAKGEVEVIVKRQMKCRIYDPSASPPVQSQERLPLASGPHLLLDEHWVQEPVNLSRKVNRPVRTLDGPVVTGGAGKGDNCFQPYLSVVRDPATGRFRIWYGVPENVGQSHVATMESEDGVNWIRPHRVLEDPSPIQFGVSILDKGQDCKDPAARFKYGYYGLMEGGLRVAISPDGLQWKPLVDHVVLVHSHDINSIGWDPLRGRYMALVSAHTSGETWSGERRIPMESVSPDLVHWEEPWVTVAPNHAIDQGETQFYGMDGILARGEVLISMIKVLRDDLPADPDVPAAGIGYTCLGWSWDGETWIRDREPFMDRNPDTGTWDHAMAWIDEQVPVGDEVYLYYGGYARGHKINRFEERQIGLVRMPRDRYVAWEAGDTEGGFRTPVFQWQGRGLSLNVDASQGTVLVEVCDKNGVPKKGFAFQDCEAIRTDSLSASVRWKGDLSELDGSQVFLKFSLTRSRLFAFEVLPAALLGRGQG